MSCKHLVDLNDFEVNEWEELIVEAKQIMDNTLEYSKVCSGKLMAVAFYEPSTRTRLSFEAAMKRLGGGVIGFSDVNSSSVSKGESLKDTMTVMGSYADILVLRHPVAGAAKAASLFSASPVINAGDGGHLHPTQTLTDLLTLSLECKTLNGLKIGICGDLKFGRTAHSLVKALKQYKNNSFVFISTPQLKMPEYITEKLTEMGISYTETFSLDEAISELDVLYMTRIQRERFADEDEYISQKDVYILDNKKLLTAKKTLKILHPLPRVDEIAVEVDDDPRAVYFKQARYGQYIRMALICKMLNDKPSTEKKFPILGYECSNEKCITKSEKYLPVLDRLGRGEHICEYCDSKLQKQEKRSGIVFVTE